MGGLFVKISVKGGIIMVEMFSQYIYYIDIGLLVFVGLFVLGGLIAGVKRSLISLVLLVSLVFGLYIMLNPLGNLLLDIEIGQFGISTIRESLIEGVVESVPQIASLMVEGNEVYEFFMSVAVTSMRLLLFFVGSLLIIFLIEPFLRLIVKAILGVGRKTKRNYRLLGAVVNGLKGLFILTMILFPISGLFGLAKEAQSLIEDNDLIEMSLTTMDYEEEEQQSSEIFEIIDLYENLRVKKIINFSRFVFQKPLDEYIFNKTLLLTHNGKKIYFLEDVEKELKIVSIFFKYYENDSFDIYKVSEEDLTAVFDALKEIKLYDILIPVAVEVALNLDEVKSELVKYNVTPEDLRNIKWAEDFDLLLDVAKEVILLGELNEETLKNIDINRIRTIVNKLASTSVLQFAFPIALDYLVTLDEVKPYLGDDFTFDYDEINLATELGVIVDIFEQFRIIGYEGFDFDALLKDEDKFDAALIAIEKLGSSNLLKQALPRVVDNLMKDEISDNLGGIIQLDGVENIGAEVQKILQIIKDINALGINLSSGNLDDIDLTSLKTEDVLNIIDQIFALEVFDEEELFRALFKELKIEGADDYDFGDLDITEEKQAIKNVVSNIVIFIKEANTTKFDDFLAIIKDETNRENLLDVIGSASQSKVMVEVVLKLFSGLLSENMPEELGDILDLSNLPATSWRSESEKLLEIFMDITDANLFGEGEMNLNNDLIIRIVENIFDLELIKGNEEKIFKELFKMIPVIDDYTPNYENINWDSEPDKIIDILLAVANIGDISDFDFNDINTLTVEKITDLIKAVNHSQVFRPMLLKVIDKEVVNTNVGDWLTPWFTDQIDSTMASVEDWDEEIDVLASLIVNLADFDLNGFDIENATDEKIDTLGEILKDINKSKIFNMNKLTSILEVSNNDSILFGADFSNLPTTEAAWDEEIDVLVQLLKWFNKAQPIGINKYVELGKLLNIMKQSTIIGPNLKVIIEKATEQMDDQFDSYVDLSKVDLDAIDWEAELQALYNIYSAFGSDAGTSSFTDIATRITDSGDSNAILVLLQNINNSDLIRQMLPKMIHEALVAVSLTDWEANWFKDQYAPGGVMATKAEWAIEIVNLSSLIAETVGFNINSFDMENSPVADIDKLGVILTDINHSRILNIDKITSILEISDSSSILYGADFTHLPTNTTAWDEEITTLVAALKQLKNIQPVVMNKHLEIGTLLNTIQNSVILGHNLELIIENALKQVDADFMTYVDLSTIDVYELDWVAELGTLETLHTDFGSFTGVGFSLDTLDGEDITNIMEKASQGVITTQIFGKLFNEQLAVLFGTHNPNDEHGVLIYDYTDQQVLSGNAEDVGKLVDFGNEIRVLFQDPYDETQGVAVGDFIKSYKVTDGTPRPTFADVYFPAILAYAKGIEEESPLEGVNMTLVDYEVEGQFFIDFYQADGSDQLIVLQDINEHSTLTKAIMVSMGFTF